MVDVRDGRIRRQITVDFDFAEAAVGQLLRLDVVQELDRTERTDGLRQTHVVPAILDKISKLSDRGVAGAVTALDYHPIVESAGVLDGVGDVEPEVGDEVGLAVADLDAAVFLS